MDSITINGTLRTDFGKKANKALRREGQVPCVIYGGDKPVHFNAKANAFKSLIYTPDFKSVEINVDGASYKCILKDSQFHPVTDAVVHLDFLELVPQKSIKIEIPVRFKGVSPGVKSGGKLMQLVRRVKVKTTPEHLVDQVTIDISSLELGSSIRIRDIQLTEGIEILNTSGTPVASVEVPRALKSPEEEEEEAAAAAAAAEAEAETATAATE